MLEDEDFNFDIIRGLLRRRPQVDIVRVHDVTFTYSRLGDIGVGSYLELAAQVHRFLDHLPHPKQKRDTSPPRSYSAVANPTSTVALLRRGDLWHSVVVQKVSQHRGLSRVALKNPLDDVASDSP
jgi:hypothetical protein